MRIELTPSAWKAEVLPLNYTRINFSFVYRIIYPFFLSFQAGFQKKTVFFRKKITNFLPDMRQRSELLVRQNKIPDRQIIFRRLSDFQFPVGSFRKFENHGFSKTLPERDFPAVVSEGLRQSAPD